MKAGLHTLLFFLVPYCCAACNRYSYRCDRPCNSFLVDMQEPEETQTNTELEHAYNIEEEPGDPGLFAHRIKYKISAVGIHKPKYGGKAHAYIDVDHNGNSHKRDICVICKTNNPVWPDEMVIDYVEGSQTYVKIAVYDETVEEHWTGDDKYTEYVGTAYFYAKNMLINGSRQETPLWNGDSPAGTAILHVVNAIPTRYVKKSEANQTLFSTKNLFYNNTLINNNSI